MKAIKKHKKKILIGVIVLFVLLVLYLIWTMLPNSSKSLYGDRLDGIEDVEVTDSDLSKITKALEKEDGVASADSDIKGRLINFTVQLDDGVDPTIGDTLGSVIIDKFSEEELEFYDLQLFLDGDLEQYPVIGYKHKTSDKFVWSNNN